MGTGAPMHSVGMNNAMANMAGGLNKQGPRNPPPSNNTPTQAEDSLGGLLNSLGLGTPGAGGPMKPTAPSQSAPKHGGGASYRPGQYSSLSGGGNSATGSQGNGGGGFNLNNNNGGIGGGGIGGGGLGMGIAGGTGAIGIGQGNIGGGGGFKSAGPSFPIGGADSGGVGVGGGGPGFGGPGLGGGLSGMPGGLNRGGVRRRDRFRCSSRCWWSSRRTWYRSRR